VPVGKIDKKPKVAFTLDLANSDAFARHDRNAAP
jgi:hypothetical protein